MRAFAIGGQPLQLISACRVRFSRETWRAASNDHPVNDLPNSPLDGEKNSGRFGGDWAIAAFTIDQWLTVQHTPRALPF